MQTQQRIVSMVDSEKRHEFVGGGGGGGYIAAIH